MDESMQLRSLPSRIRELLFIYQDGFILALIVAALSRTSILTGDGTELTDGCKKLSLGPIPVSIKDLADNYQANEAYLDVVLRSLAQQGWLQRFMDKESQSWHYITTPAFIALTPNELENYRQVGECLTALMPIEDSVFCEDKGEKNIFLFEQLVAKAAANWPRCTSLIVKKHLTGALLVPVLLGLHATGHCNVETESVSNFSQPILNLLLSTGLVHEDCGGWTEDGNIARRHAIYLGMVGSYIATLKKLRDLIFGNFALPTHSQPGQIEIHVNRELNIQASAAAHIKYFTAADEIIIDIFDKLPLEHQPKIVMDMGCGDGSWLVHIHQVILSRTIRGKNLESYPVIMIGVDYNFVCREICMNSFRRHGIEGKFILGDITNLGMIANAIAKEGLNMSDCLHVRSFIDHNRIYKQPRNKYSLRSLLPTGAYVDAEDKPIQPGDMRQNLVEFLEAWAPYAEPHGLLIIEAHCVDPKLTAQHIGAIHNLVFDTYHGLSRQYPVDFNVFMECAEEAGLRSVSYQQYRYPTRKPFVAISINRFLRHMPFEVSSLPRSQGACINRSGKWLPAGKSPTPDGLALHHFLYKNGDLDRQMNWCRDSTGHIIGNVMRYLRERVRTIEILHSADRVLHIVDYGAGSGMASIELLRAMTVSGLMEQFQAIGVSLRLSLVDLPNDWFAMGYSLLADCSLVEFHSLRDDDGNFRQLSEIFGSDSVDIVLASMVFHLVPASALEKLFRGLSDVLKIDGLLAWSSPDIGSVAGDAVLFHDVNRATRRQLLQYLESPDSISLSSWEGGIAPKNNEIAEALQRRSNELSATQRAEMAVVAEKQILSVPNTLEIILHAAIPWFATKDTRIGFFEISTAELLSLALIPSNIKYFCEVSDLPCFVQLLTRILEGKVVKDKCFEKARTCSGLSVQWTFGYWRKEQT